MNGVFAQWLDLILTLWWPFCRLGTAVMVAPFVGEAMVPLRVRLGLVLCLAIATLPATRQAPAVDPFTLHAVVLTLEQAVIGLLFGLAFQLVMAALAVLGSLLSSQMGLSMATLNDPGNANSSDVVSVLLYLLAALLFFAMDGHLVLVQVVYHSFAAWPVGGGVAPLALSTLAGGLSWALAAALLLALPAVFATFVVQAGFGLINRAAPALNLFSLGFPLVTLFGLLALTLVVRTVPEHYLRLSAQLLRFLSALQGGGHG